MKLNENQNFLLFTIGAASLAASFAFGNTETQPGNGPAPVAALHPPRVVDIAAQNTQNPPNKYSGVLIRI